MKFIYYNDFVIINSLKMRVSTLSPDEWKAMRSYMRYNTVCSEEVMQKIRLRLAVRVISNAQLGCLSHHKCDTCTDCRVSKDIVNMRTPTILGGSGYKCWRHLCTCRKQVYYRTEYCPGCGCLKCVLCSRRCRCINKN